MAAPTKAKPRVYTAGKRQTVQHPLDPSMMTEMGVLEAASLPSGPFEPAGGWTHTYRVWTCYGYRSGSNRDQGLLTIRRKGDSDRKTFRLQVEQSIEMDPKKEQDVHHVAAEISCRNDELASPAAWTFTSRFTHGSERTHQSEIDHAEKARRKGATLEVEIGTQQFRRDVSDRFTADWCLFEAVERLPFAADDALRFDLLEGLTVWKPGQRLSYRGKFPVSWGSRSLKLDCFEQLGMGVWPYEYWLDEQHRLLLVITGARAYIWEASQGGEK